MEGRRGEGEKGSLEAEQLIEKCQLDSERWHGDVQGDCGSTRPR